MGEPEELRHGRAGRPGGAEGARGSRLPPPTARRLQLGGGPHQVGRGHRGDLYIQVAFTRWVGDIGGLIYTGSSYQVGRGHRGDLYIQVALTR